jgi:hypothetical protein
MCSVAHVIQLVSVQLWWIPVVKVAWSWIWSIYNADVWFAYAAVASGRIDSVWDILGTRGRVKLIVFWNVTSWILAEIYRFWRNTRLPSVQFFSWRNSPSGPGPLQYRGFTITLRHTTLGRTPLDEWLARRRDLYLTTHNTRKRQTSMPPAGFKPAVPASERPQNHALDRAAAGIGSVFTMHFENGDYVSPKRE